MPYVLTVDQRASRRGPDRVAGVLQRLAAGELGTGQLGTRGAVRPLLGFERTAGDEFQGVLADPRDAVAVVLDLVREGGWSIGIGAGPVQTPLPDSTRAAAGPAFVCARRAVEAAKSRPARVAVRGTADDDAADAQAVLTALAVLLQRRSPAAWEAVALVEAGRTQAEAAAQLGITRQAVGQRLAAGAWELERDLRPTAARLLARAAG